MPTPEEVNEAVRRLQAHFNNPKAQEAYRQVLAAPIPDRRQSSPEYRERVDREAKRLVTALDHDYDAALDYITEQARGDVAFLADVESLLRRRAETVKGLRV